MKLFFPESFGQIDYVGYNHAVSLFHKALKDRITKDTNEADARVYFNLPYYQRPQELTATGLPLIVFTMFETTVVPSNWVRFLNKFADVVIVPSYWNFVNFKRSGVKKPILVVSLGYDPEKFQIIKKSEMKELYVYMWQGVSLDMGGRKGYDTVLHAYRELRKEGKIGNDSRLIIKVRPHRLKAIEMFKVDTGDGIIIEQRNILRTSMMEMYKKVDCCINPTHGEGFGLIPLEQMAMGKPVIVPNWSMPYVSKEHNILVPYELKKSNINWTHRSLHISRNGIAVNFGGLPTEISWFPKPINRRGVGQRIEIPGVPSRHSKRIPLHQRMWGRFINKLSDIQIKYGLVTNHAYYPKTLWTEYPGKDAWISVGDLKRKMLWCYNNRKEANEIGLKAAEFVRKNWTLETLRREFLAAEPELTSILEGRK